MVKRIPSVRFAHSLSRLSHEPQIGGRAAGADRLGLVARFGPVGGARAPVAGAPRGPREIGRLEDVLEHPGEIVRMVGREPQLGAVPQHPRQLGEPRRPDQPPLVVPGLAPRIGEQHEGAADRSFGQRREQRRRLAVKDADIGKVFARDAGEQRGDSGLVDLGADEADLRIARRLPQQVLARAEADLEPDPPDRRIEARALAERLALGRQSHREPRQELVHQPLPARAQLAPALAPVALRGARRPAAAHTGSGGRRRRIGAGLSRR